MKWKAVDKYCIRSGPYRIAKTMHSGEMLYVLSYDNQTLGMYDDADEARDYAGRHQQRRAATKGN